MHRLCTGHAQAMHRPCTGHALAMHRLCTGYAQAMHRPDAQAMHRLLLSTQAVLGVRDDEGLSALHMLVKGGHMAGAALLLGTDGMLTPVELQPGLGLLGLIGSQRRAAAGRGHVDGALNAPSRSRYSSPPLPPGPGTTGSRWRSTLWGSGRAAPSPNEMPPNRR